MAIMQPSTGHIPYYFIGGVPKLEPEDAEHFLRVMRGREGDALEISDGRGRHWSARAGRAGKREVRVELREELPPEAPPAIAVASALPKGQRASDLVEKTVEMGISDLHFIVAEFSSVRELTPGMLRRFEAVARSAAMQSRRAWIPAIHDAVPLTVFLEKHSPCAVLDQAGSRAGWERLSSEKGWVLLVGPEGGWSPGEVESFAAKGIPLLPLTDHPLRMETAAMAGLAFYYRSA
jgi:16S rRNA (uracil1498-N3)-methyltransferase